MPSHSYRPRLWSPCHMETFNISFPPQREHYFKKIVFSRICPTMAAPWHPKWHRSGLGGHLRRHLQHHLHCEVSSAVSVGVSDRSYSGALVAPLGVPMAIPARSDAVPESSAPAFFGEGGEDGALMLQCSDDALGWLWDCVFTSGIYSRG